MKSESKDVGGSFSNTSIPVQVEEFHQELWR